MKQILFILSFCLFVIACETKPAQKGKVAPQFEATSNTGEKLKLSNYKGKKVYLNFWTVTCKPCLEDFYTHQSLMNSLATSPTQTLLHICLDADHTKIASYLKLHELKLRNSYTAANPDDIISKYTIGAFPHHVVIDKTGIVVRNDYRKLFEEIE